jgi:hypothetical protein
VWTYISVTPPNNYLIITLLVNNHEISRYLRRALRQRISRCIVSGQLDPHSDSLRAIADLDVILRSCVFPSKHSPHPAHCFPSNYYSTFLIAPHCTISLVLEICLPSLLHFNLRIHPNIHHLTLRSYRAASIVLLTCLRVSCWCNQACQIYSLLC